MAESQQGCTHLDEWKDVWDRKQQAFHEKNVHPMLVKYFDKLFPKGTVDKVFIPLCGKTIDMKWLADSKSIPVIGVEGVSKALDQFFADHGTDFSKENVPSLGEEAQLYKSKDNSINLYCCDIMDFSELLEGTFHAVWDRGSLVAVNREDLHRYVAIIKNLMKPGGRCLVETMEYDMSKLKEFKLTGKIPPPYPMLESDMKALYEPECTVEFLDREAREIHTMPVNTLIFLITKK